MHRVVPDYDFLHRVRHDLEVATYSYLRPRSRNRVLVSAIEVVTRHQNASANRSSCSNTADAIRRNTFQSGVAPTKSARLIAYLSNTAMIAFLRAIGTSETVRPRKN